MTAALADAAPAPADRQALGGLRVIDLSRWVAGEFCTKFFADFGADVVKVERPGEGSLTRTRGPFHRDVQHSEGSALFLHLNTNKRSLTLDLASESGRQIHLDLVRTADLVVESFRPGTLERLGLGPDELHAANPRTVLTRISAFGQTGPYRDREATGLTLQAAGGPMNATGSADRPPHRKPGLLEHYTIGRMAAEASMAGLMARLRSGRGAVVDVAGMEVLLAGADRRASYLLTAAYSGVDAPRGVRSAHRGAATFTGAYRCADGFVMVYVTNQQFWNRFVDMVADGDEEFRARFHDRYRQRGGDGWAEFAQQVEDWFAARPKLSIMEIGQRMRIPVTAFLTVRELLAVEHFRSRGCFVPADHPHAGRLEYLGPPWRMERGWQLRSTAPLLGADTEDVLAEVGVDAARLAALRAEGVV
jgi:crotonobetainyl-CoA:carnitine CoA-transferase CaiB-like acyl-CoA transferase